MTKQEAIETIKLALSQVEWDYPLDYAAAFDMAISAMEKQDVPDICVGDMISRRDAIDAMCELMHHWFGDDPKDEIREIKRELEKLQSAQSERLTDKEQRIFLAAMGREEKLCEEVDRIHIREPYEDSLMRVCKEIRRKVKGALWT